MGLGVFFLISIRDSILPIIQKFVHFVVDWANAIFVDFTNTLQALVEWANKHPEKVGGFIASVGLLGLCYYLMMTSLKHRHYIYQRFRIGHFSQMMWFGIGSLDENALCMDWHFRLATISFYDFNDENPLSFENVLALFEE